MHKSIVVFEVEGGSDKQFNGHRKDTMPIVDAISGPTTSTTTSTTISMPIFTV